MPRFGASLEGLVELSIQLSAQLTYIRGDTGRRERIVREGTQAVCTQASPALAHLRVTRCALFCGSTCASVSSLQAPVSPR